MRLRSFCDHVNVMVDASLSAECAGIVMTSPALVEGAISGLGGGERERKYAKVELMAVVMVGQISPFQQRFRFTKDILLSGGE